MKTIRLLALCAVAFLFIAAPIYMKQGTHPVYAGGTLIGTAVMINGEPALPVAALSKLVSGNLVVRGNTLTLEPPALQASASSDTFTLVNGGVGGNSQKRAATGGGGAGRATFQPFRIVHRIDKASAVLFNAAHEPYVRVSDVATLLGGTLTLNGGTLAAGQPINLTPAANGAIILQR